MSQFRFAVLSVVSVLSAQVFAGYDADTIGFYRFMEKAPGETAETGDFVLNDVSSGTHLGTVKRLGSSKGGYGTLTYESFPFPYVYSDVSCRNLLTSTAQAIHIQTNAVQTKCSAAVVFFSLAQELRQHGGDYTIECFWKDNNGFWGGNYWVSISESVRVEHAYLIGYPREDSSGKKFRNALRLLSGPYSSASWNGEINYPESVSDGRWHHLALIYDATAKTIDIRGDYTLKIGKLTDESKLPQSTSCGLVLGAPLYALSGSEVNSNPDLQLACLRVTKRKLAVEEFMRAYSAPVEMFLEDETVFHWGFDGADGEKIVNIASRRTEPEWLTMHQQYYYRNWDCGTTYIQGGTATNPVYRVESNRVKRALRAGAKVITINNLTSGELCSNEAGPSGLSSGYGYAWVTNSLSPETDPFTLECLVRLNLPNWQGKIIDVNVAQGNSRWRTAIMGRMLAYEEGVWRETNNNGAFQLRVTPGKTGKTGFEIPYTYYDANHLPQRESVTVLNPGAKTARTMSNVEFGNSYHHFAFTYDPAALKLTLFIDYVQHNTISLKGPLTLDHSPRWLFGTGYNNCAFDGWYDEIRLSRKILAPSEFLRMSRPNRPFMVIYR